MSTTDKIISARIVSAAASKTNQAEVYATFDNGNEISLFRYFDDELFFQPAEFVGLTVTESFALLRKKDTAYLQSPGPAANGTPQTMDPVVTDGDFVANKDGWDL